VSLRIGVTGASGFIGRHVVTTLAARGDVVSAISRPFIRSELANAFRNLDAIVHLAGVVAAVRNQAFQDGNVECTRIVAEAAAESGVRLVHISSLAAAGPAPATAPRGEDDPESPTNAYGRSKLEGERVVRSLPELRWTILRPGVVYGPGDRALLPLFRYARRGVLPVVGDPSAAYTFIYVADAVRAILAAVDQQVPGETFFLGYSTPVAARELLDEVRRALGSGAVLVPVPKSVVRLAALAGDVSGYLTGTPSTINSRRFAELFSPGYVCRVDRMGARLKAEAQVGLRKGLSITAAWYRVEGWL
jgi:nucleoside-diphosphate-sugar epimerase